jgi:hypothetical protein
MTADEKFKQFYFRPDTPFAELFIKLLKLVVIDADDGVVRITEDSLMIRICPVWKLDGIVYMPEMAAFMENQASHFVNIIKPDNVNAVIQVLRKKLKSDQPIKGIDHFPGCPKMPDSF